MGTWLFAKKNNEIISLGRSYNYKIDDVLPENYNDVWDEIDRIINNTKVKLSSFAAYSPNDLEELDNIVSETEEELEFLKEELVRCGKSLVITELKEEGFEITEE